ncbi:MAG: hypothetical protein LUD47_01155 [Clostridia bacterium]|nr:hypothetical protein [Clostridia bacterium]
MKRIDFIVGMIEKGAKKKGIKFHLKAAKKIRGRKRSEYFEDTLGIYTVLNPRY